MISFYYHPTPNPAKVALFLEEAEIDYKLIPVDTSRHAFKAEWDDEAKASLFQHGRLTA